MRGNNIRGMELNMEQLSFENLFKRNEYVPLEYELRTDSNGRHDIIFLASYLHDAGIFLKTAVFKRRELTLSLERTCWELFTDRNRELHCCQSNLCFFNVIDYRYSFSHILLKDGEIPDRVDINDFSVSFQEKAVEIKLILKLNAERPAFELAVLVKKEAEKYLVLTDVASSFT